MSETKHKLLDAAIVEFAELGFDKANVNHIAEAAGFSVGTLYNYFPTKRDLMHAVIVEISGLHVAHIVDQVHQTEDPSHGINAFFEAGFSFVESNLTQARAIFNTLNGPDEAFKAQLFEAYQPLFELLGKDIIGNGLVQGVFHDVDPSSTARLIMCIYLGVGSQFNNEGKLWMKAAEASQFVLKSLRYTKKVE